MDDEAILEQIKRLSVWSGHRQMTIEDIARIQPGLARIMPEVGDRTWKLYYAAQAENWPLAAFQAKEIRGLMDLCAFTRPKHEDALRQFVVKNWQPVQDAVAKQDRAAFEEAFHKSIKAANAYWCRRGGPPPTERGRRSEV